MKNWINKNYKTLIIAAFLVPIITVAIVSISHVTKWYGISNPVSWAVYLSIGIEIAALSALAAISADMGRKVYFPFAIVTLVQFIGNIFFAYSYIDINSQSFKDWVDLVAPLLEFMAVEPTDFIGHKRFLALFAGGMLPIISLSFLHMLVKFSEEDRLKQNDDKGVDEKIQDNLIKADLTDEEARLKLSQRDLEILERYLSNPPEPNEALKNAFKAHKERMEKATMASDEQPDEIVEEPIVEETSLEDEILKDAVKQFDADVFTTLKDDVDKEEQKEALIELMRLDQELGLYDEPKLDHTTPVEEKIEEAPVVDENVLTEPERQFYVDDEMVTHEIENEEYIPSKEDEELNFINTINEDNINDSGEFIIDTFATAEQVKKHNIDETIAQIQEDFKTIDNNSFWRDHIQDDADEDLKKKS
jgi:hypothetical protein